MRSEAMGHHMGQRVYGQPNGNWLGADDKIRVFVQVRHEKNTRSLRRIRIYEYARSDATVPHGSGLRQFGVQDVPSFAPPGVPDEVVEIPARCFRGDTMSDPDFRAMRPAQLDRAITRWNEISVAMIEKIYKTPAGPVVERVRKIVCKATSSPQESEVTPWPHQLARRARMHPSRQRPGGLEELMRMLARRHRGDPLFSAPGGPRTTSSSAR